MQKLGYDVVIDSTGPTVLWDREWDNQTLNEPPPESNAQILGIAKRPDADVIVMQRPGRRYWAEMIPMLQEMGIRIVVDVDDNMEAIHRDNGAYWGYNPRTRDVPYHSKDWVKEACKRADLVTVTTPALRSVYGFGHCRVLPNYVPQSYLGQPEPEKRQDVGWAGSLVSHPHDLQVTKGAIPRALENSDWGFHVVGTGRGVKDALGLVEEPTATEKVEFFNWLPRVAELGIGIVPLEDTAFNRAKSCLKMLEMAAGRVPVVASPTPDNLRLNAEGVGVIAQNSQQWFKKVRALIKSKNYRDDLAGRGFEAMKHQTYEEHIDLWVKAWTGTKAKVDA